MMKVKNVLKKLLVSILIILTLCNFMISSGGPIGIVEASEDPEPGQTNQEQIDALEESAETLINARNNGITGVLTWLLKILVIGLASTFQIETFFVANSAGNDGSLTSAFVTPLDIFFNRFTLVDVNIFSDKDAAGNALDTDGLVYSIRSNASMWYYIFQGIAIAILLVVLIMNGIKLLKNTADRLAEFKKIMFDWVVSFVLLMFLHMLIIFIIGVNEIFVGVIEKAADATNISNLMDALMVAAFSENYLIGMASTIVYVMMVVQTIIYLFIYIKRFLTTVFLIIIAPIVTVTYSIDRADGGKAKALNGWLREFLYNVAVQSLHCVIYVVMVGVALSALGGVSSVTGLENIGAAVIAIFAMAFIKKAEELLREILGFNKATTLSSHKSVVNSAVSIASTGVAIATGGARPAMPGGMAFGQNINGMFPNSASSNPTQPSLFSRAGNYFAEKINYARDEYRNITEESYDDQTESRTRSELFRSSDTGEAGQDENSPVPAPMGTGMAMLGMTMLGDAINKENDKNIQEGMKGLLEAVNSTKPKTDKPADRQATSNSAATDDSDDDSNVKLDELLDELKVIESDQKHLLDMLEQLNEKKSKADELGSKLEDGEADILKRNLDKLESDQIDEYINSLEPEQQEFARAYLDYKDEEQAYDELGDELVDKSDQWVSRARNNGIDVDKGIEAQLLAGGSVALGALSQLREKVQPNPNPAAGVGTNANSGRIAEATRRAEDTSTPTVDENDGDEETVVDLPSEVRNALDESAISQDATDALRDKTVREQTKDAMKLIDIFEGKATIEADLTDESLTNFNVEILSKVQQGVYSQSNFKAAEARVKQEGDAAVRRLEAFKHSQTEANARALSPAGQEYARLMVEARQAGMIVSTMRISSEQSMQVEKNVTTAMYQETVTPTNTTNNVINNLNAQRPNQE